MNLRETQMKSKNSKAPASGHREEKVVEPLFAQLYNCPTSHCTAPVSIHQEERWVGSLHSEGA